LEKNGLFGKNFRLLSAADFQYLKKNSHLIKDGSLRAYYYPSRLKGIETRIGLSIPKRIGKGFLRNRIKRLIREKFRLSTYKYLGLDILFVVSGYLKFEKGDREAENRLLESLEKLFQLVAQLSKNKS